MLSFPDIHTRYFGGPTTPGNISSFVSFSAIVQILVFFSAYFVFSNNGISKESEIRIYFLFFTLSPILSLIGFYVWNRIYFKIRFKSILILIPPIAIIAFGLSHIHRLIYFTHEVPAPHVPLSIMRFLGGALFYSLIAIGLIWRSHREPSLETSDDPEWRSIPALIKVIGFTLIASLFDIYMMVDTLSYSPYMAPAFLVANGHIPLINAFSQYGLNFTIFAAAFLVLPQSFFTVAAIVGLLNVLMYMLFVGIAVNLSRNKTIAFVASVSVVLFVHSAYLYNINYTPSVFAMRFLPPFLLLFALTRLRSSHLFSAFSITSLTICSLWSLEALMYGALTYSGYLVLSCIGHRYSALQFARDITLIVATVCIPHLVLSMIYLILFGALPDYKTYLELVFSYINDGRGYWKLLSEPGIRVWALFGFAYATALSLASWIAYQRFNDKKELSQSMAISGAVSIFGILAFFYYVERSATPVLMFICLPLLIVTIIAVDWAVTELRCASVPPIRAVDGFAPLVLLVSSVLFPLMGGVVGDKFLRPFNQLLSNSTVLRDLISIPSNVKSKSVPNGFGLPFAVPGRVISTTERFETMRSTLASSEAYPSNEAGLAYSYAENHTAFDLIKNLRVEKHKILMFVIDPVPVLFHMPPAWRDSIAYPPLNLGIMYPEVDGLSETLSKRALATLSTISVDDVVLIGQLPKSRLDETVIERLRKLWTFCQFPTALPVSAYRLRPKGDSSCAFLGSPPACASFVSASGKR